MNEELIAPCGMNCAIRSRYLAFQNDTRRRGIRIGYCIGCRPSSKNCHYKKKCELLGKGIMRFCYECQDFPCKHLKTLDKRYRTFYHMSMIDNLEYMKKNGIKQFLDDQEEKWQCPQCGATICCHDGICFNCGLELLTNKKKLYRWEDA
jgi:hypothetical protein